MMSDDLDPPSGKPTSWSLSLPGDRQLELGSRPKVMGILNITPDSFSDGGLWVEPERAVDRGLAMLAEGAEILDLGAESTRPGGGVYGEGARLLPAQEELQRLLPVLRALRRATKAPISVDTRKGNVAREALAAGADLINDVDALTDPDLGRAVAETGVPLILMHSRGELATMQQGIQYRDTLGEVRDELAARVALATELGVAPEQLILDPGIGFGKRLVDNLRLISGLGSLASLGRPILLGASRKSFIAKAVAKTNPGATPVAPADRLGGSLAAVAWAARQGATIVRVHDVAATRQFLELDQAFSQSLP